MCAIENVLEIAVNQKKKEEKTGTESYACTPFIYRRNPFFFPSKLLKFAELFCLNFETAEVEHPFFCFEEYETYGLIPTNLREDHDQQIGGVPVRKTQGR